VALRRGSLLFFLTLFFVVIPALSLAGVVENHSLNRLGRYLCFAIVALGIDLIWGYTGILSLFQALLFCLGGYCIAMHLSLPQGGGDVRAEYHNIPQFFFFNSVDALPVFWKPFASLPFSVVAGVVLPALLTSIFGFMIFRSRVKGVYFAIITQALAWGAYLAFCRNELLLGGTNGLTNFSKPLNQRREWILGLYLLSATTLAVAFLAVRFVVRSRLGRILIAIRDNESRLRFAGYRPEFFKMFAFSAAAVLAAIGGMLYVPQNGIITPNVMRVEDSIMMVIWVAVGGRGRLWGALIGALVVNFLYSSLTSDLPSLWPFFEGGMFLAIVLLFPDGLVGLWDRMEGQVEAGKSFWRPAAALGVWIAFLLVERLAPPGLGLALPGSLAFGLELAVLVAAWFLLLSARSARAAVPLMAIAGFMIAEGLGLMPPPLRAGFAGLPWKYWGLLAILVGCSLYDSWRGAARGQASPSLGRVPALTGDKP
jgi:urea transport system permease protein